MLRSAWFTFHNVLDAAEWYCSDTKCYHFKGPLRSWAESRDYCTHLGVASRSLWNASLLFIANDGEVGHVRLTLGTFHDHRLGVWINCNDIDHEGNFVCLADAKGTISHATSKHFSHVIMNNHTDIAITL